MSALSIQVPFPVFQGRDGQPLENGYVWIGEPNLNPQTNPVVAYYDAALTIVAPQPLRTLNGYVSRAGTPAQIYVDGVNFSILVQDSKGSMVYNFPDGSGISPNAAGVEYDPPFAGALTTGYTVEDKLSQTVSVKDFGAVGDGVTDDTVAIQAALSSLAIGGCVSIGRMKVLLSGGITIPAGVTLKGDWANPDQVGVPSSPTYAAYGASIRLASTATISMANASSLEGVLIYRQGMVFPVSNDSLYAGTAITAAGSGIRLNNILVMGFNKLFLSTTAQRHVFDRVYGDNRNGFDISGSPDVCYFNKCHMWPFACDTNIYPSNAVLRSGVAYYFHDTADWFEANHCFSYGYYRGFLVSSANSINFTSCSADHNFPASQAGSVGFLIDGNSSDTKLIGTRSAAQDQGVVINTTAGRHTELMGHSTWANTSHNITINDGDVSILGGISRDSVNGITVANAASHVIADGVRFSGISNQPILVSIANPNVIIGANDYGDFVAGNMATANISLLSVASASPLALPANDDVFNVTGTTNISFINGWRPKRRITLIFVGALTVANGGAGTSGIRLNGGANFTAAIGSTLSLTHDGAGWIETGRKA